MLPFAASLSLSAIAIGLSVAVLAGRLSRAAGWDDQHHLVLIALTAAAYALLDLSVSIPLPPARAVLFQRLELIPACLHVFAWLRYTDARLGRLPVSHWVGRLVVVAGLTTLIPGATCIAPVRVYTLTRLGLVYYISTPAPLFYVIAVLCLAGLGTVALRFGLAWRRGVHGAGMQVLAFGLFFAFGLHDVVAMTGYLAVPLLLDAGFLAPVVAATWVLAARFVAEARALHELRAELERTAVERARDLSATAAALARDARLAAIGRFSDAVVHAINNPTAAATANLTHVLHVLRHHRSRGSEVSEALAESRDALIQIGGITRKLLHASRVAATTPGREVVIEQAVRDAVTRARERGRLPSRVRVSVPAGLRTTVEGRGLVEILGNIVANAFDASASEVSIEASTRGGDLTLTVRDDGRGMDAGTLSRALDPFFSTKPPRLRDDVGLAVSRALLAGQGGDLRIESRLGKGTGVVLNLPVVQSVAAEALS